MKYLHIFHKIFCMRKHKKITFCLCPNHISVNVLNTVYLSLMNYKKSDKTVYLLCLILFCESF